MKSEDVPPEQFASLTVRQSLHHPIQYPFLLRECGLPLVANEYFLANIFPIRESDSTESIPSDY